MRCKILSVQDKSADWKIISLSQEKDGIQVTVTNVAVNRTNKKGEVFPDFDNIKPENVINGELWVSSAGKSYLFAPNPEKPASGAYRGNGGGSIAAQTRKKEDIREAQDKKEESIAFFNSTNSAIQLITTHPFFAEPKSEKELLEKVFGLRDKFYKEWENHAEPGAPFRS